MPAANEQENYTYKYPEELPHNIAHWNRLPIKLKILNMLKLIYSRFLTFPVIALEHFVFGLFCRGNKVPISCIKHFSLNCMQVNYQWMTLPTFTGKNKPSQKLLLSATLNSFVGLRLVGIGTGKFGHEELHRKQQLICETTDTKTARPEYSWNSRWWTCCTPNLILISSTN